MGGSMRVSIAFGKMYIYLHADPRTASTVRISVRINRLLAIHADQHSDVRAYCAVLINGWVNAHASSVQKDVC